MTENKRYTTDNGSNVEKFIQQKNYDGLFNGTQGRDFEFMWDYEGNWDAEGKLPSYITLPVTMNIALKEAALLNQVKVYNANKAKINGKSNEGNCADSQCDSDTGSHGERRECGVQS